MRLLIVSLAAIAGYALGSLSRGTATNNPARSPSAATPSPSLSTTATATARTAAPPTLREQLGGVFSAGGRRERYRRIARWVETLAPGEIAAALEVGAAIPDREMRQSVCAQLLGRWARTAPREALDWLKGATALDEGERRGCAEVILSAWGQSAPREALAFLAEQPARFPVARGEALTAIFAGWAQVDPAAAAQATASIEPGLRLGATRAVAVHWAQSDGPAALRWALGHIGAETNAWYAAASAADAWRHADGHLPVMELMLAETARLTDPKAREIVPHLFSNLADEWADVNPVEAMQFAERLTDRSTQERFLERAFSSWAHSDPDAAIAWVVQHVPPEKARDFYPALAAGLAATDAPAAAQWVAQTPALPDDAFGAVAGAWAAQDPAAAAAWLDTLPAGAGKNKAVDRFVETGFNADPAAVLDWVSQITHEGWRDGKMRELVNCWRLLDRAGAAAWLQSATLSDKLRGELGGGK